MLIFNGEAFSVDPEYIRLKCLFTGIKFEMNLSLNDFKNIVLF